MKLYGNYHFFKSIYFNFNPRSTQISISFVKTWRLSVNVIDHIEEICHPIITHAEGKIISKKKKERILLVMVSLQDILNVL